MLPIALVAELQIMGFELSNKAHSQVSQSVKDQQVLAYVSEQTSQCSKDIIVQRASDYASPMQHPLRCQPNDAVFSTPHSFSMNQNQDAAIADVMPHQAPQTCGVLPQQSRNQVFNSLPVRQHSGSICPRLLYLDTSRGIKPVLLYNLLRHEYKLIRCKSQEPLKPSKEDIQNVLILTIIAHRKSHTLRKCRGFHKKSINDCKKLLKEHYICLCCCSATDHFAKNCTSEIKCIE